MSDSRPLPVITEHNRPFWLAAADHRLVLPACVACDRVFYPIGPMCPYCHSAEPGWRQVSGRGTISSFVVYHQAFFPYFKDRLPYAVAQVELEESPRLNGNVLEVPPSALYIGMPVEVTFEKVSDDVTLPQFRPARS
jgi:uncharacterized OB-fold protein